MKTQTTTRRYRLSAILAVAIATIATCLVSTAGPIAAQEPAIEARVAARQLDTGKVEFAVQIRNGAAWGPRLLPQQRLFPADATVGRWLVSFAVTTTAGAARVAARQLDTGKIEFALQVRNGGDWGPRLLPQQRLFPADAAVGRWLVSSAVTTTAAVAGAGGCYAYPAHVPQHTRDRLGCLPDDGTIRLFMALGDSEVPAIEDNPDFRLVKGRWQYGYASRPLDIAVGTRIETYSTDRASGWDKYMTVLRFNSTGPGPWSSAITLTNVDVCVHIYDWTIDADRTPAFQRTIWVNTLTDQLIAPLDDGRYSVGSFRVGHSRRGACTHPAGG